MTVTVRDNGASKLLARARELARGRQVRVGILDDAPKDVRPGEKPPPYSLVEIAAVHEFGAPDAGIPQRSFIRATVDERRADIERLQRVLAAQVVEGKITADQALDLLGAKVAGWIQKRIGDGIEPALAPATVAAKGSSKPLVDTGQLKSAITWKVDS